ncbi:mechanosensitive ion channel family protein [Riemerella columbina]|uniref:mechanosensitive ion channel family protein n=1 Tax=Riemerella columbina TaxID=103810 RepID=UPI00035E03F3|nr:mechanosensitive ion channel domain-containing protein [Riemerella columbina]
MNDELKDTKDFLQQISDQLHFWVRKQLPDDWILLGQILIKALLLLLIVLAIDIIFKYTFKFLFYLFKKHDQKPIIKALYNSKIANSIAHFFAIGIAREMIYSIFYRHPKSYGLLETLFALVFVVLLAVLYVRLLKALERYYIYKKDSYRITTIRAITQSLKIIGYLMFGFIGISIMFDINSSTIIGSLGAMTAVIMLVFRDTILGFVTGIHVSTSKNMKVGDWIGIPKYQIEGTIEDINLLTTKILNFDKTISTIPTYDLLSTEIKNMQVMSETNTRRIKRVIYFNIKSFKFLTKEEIELFSQVDLLETYIKEKKLEIKASNDENNPLNQKQLTNIGTFRVYAFNYLLNHPKIDQESHLMVRQLESSPQGLPLEIYCFTNDSKWEHYEGIQADIFDHLLVAAQKFDLEVMQVSFKV